VKQVGDDSAGFSIVFNHSENTVRVRAWGFWNAEVAASFGPAVAAECKLHWNGAALVMDMTQLKPMRDEGQKSFVELVAALSSLGMTSVTVEITSQLTKLQLLRLVGDQKAMDRIRFQ
jgi:hypothetical protein